MTLRSLRWDDKVGLRWNDKMGPAGLDQAMV